MDIKYRPEIDGLRAIAVLAVVFYHAGYALDGNELFSGGYIGVDIFFVISGYLITSIIYKGLKQGNFSFAHFYERRVRRILPALFTVLLACLPFAIILLIPWQLIDFGRSALASLFFVSNIYFWKESGYFAPATDQMPLLHTWSLANEEQFYILYPLCLFLIWKYLPRYLLGIMFLALILSLWFAESVTPEQHEYSFYLLNCRMWELLGGSVLAKIELDRGRNNPAALERILPALGLLLIIFPIFTFDDETLHPGYITSIPVVGAMLIIWYSKPGGWFTHILSFRPVVFTGLISYSLYLWHYPIFAFSNVMNLSLNNLYRTAFIVIAVLLSLLSYHFVEQPFRRRTRDFRKVAVFCGVSALLLVLSSTLFLSTEGGLGRYRPEDLALVNISPDEHGQYVRLRYRQYLNRAFEANAKPKVLIIGDSYGQDLVNALAESKLIDAIDLSAYTIAARCGNLFLDQDLSNNIDANNRQYCESLLGYNDPQLRSKMNEADFIWLSSSWLPWHAELLPESVENIRSITKARILILGRKNYGSFSMQELIAIPLNERVNARKPVTSMHWETNELMKSNLDQEDFIDLQQLICDGMKTCPIFDADLNLISYDGYHLTPAGALLLGNKLKELPVFSELVLNEENQ